MDLTSPLVTPGRAVGICMSNVNPHVAASTGHQRAGTAPPFDEEGFFFNLSQSCRIGLEINDKCGLWKKIRYDEPAIFSIYLCFILGEGVIQPLAIVRLISFN